VRIVAMIRVGVHRVGTWKPAGNPIPAEAGGQATAAKRSQKNVMQTILHSRGVLDNLTGKHAGSATMERVGHDVRG